jgi:hypothetical protein
MLIHFDGRRVIVAGAASGIGRAAWAGRRTAASVIFLAPNRASRITRQIMPVTGSPLP